MIHPVCRFFFFFNDTATTEIYTLSLHDALPIFQKTTGDDMQLHPALAATAAAILVLASATARSQTAPDGYPVRAVTIVVPFAAGGNTDVKTRLVRSEEHTSELQSPCNLVCRLLL